MTKDCDLQTGGFVSEGAERTKNVNHLSSFPYFLFAHNSALQPRPSSKFVVLCSCGCNRINYPISSACPVSPSPSLSSFHPSPFPHFAYPNSSVSFPYFVGSVQIR